MSDFCRQCSMELFGEYIDDLSGLVSPEKVAGGMVAMAICEGCGPTYVDHTGKCVYKYCMKGHGK